MSVGSVIFRKSRQLVEIMGEHKKSEIRDESPLRVIIRGASERGAILAQAILRRVETANLSDANVGVAPKVSCAVGVAIVCVENLAHLIAVAGRVVSGATSSGA